MTESNNILERAQLIQTLIADDRVPEAVKMLLDFVRDFSEDKEDVNEVIVISSSYNRLDKAERRRTLPYEQIEERRNQLIYQILGLLDSIENALAFKLAS